MTITEGAPTSLNHGVVGAPRTLSADEGTCACVSVHTPAPRELHVHHIVPRAWGGGDEDDNLAVLCPTAHANVHRAIREAVRHGRPVNRYNTYTLILMRKALLGRPAARAVPP